MLNRNQKLDIREWAKTRGIVYFYRDWQRVNDHYSGFIRTYDFRGKYEFGLHLYDDGKVILVSIEHLHEIESEY